MPTNEMIALAELIVIFGVVAYLTFRYGASNEEDEADDVAEQPPATVVPLRPVVKDMAA